MIRSLTIEGYRGFKRFTMSELGRVNLLVGTNNSGKTSVLEAVDLLVSQATPRTLKRIMDRRGEYLPEESDRRGSGLEFDIRHLFSGHEIDVGTKFEIRAYDESAGQSVSCGIICEAKEDEFVFDGRDEPGGPLLLVIEGGSYAKRVLVRLSERDGFAWDTPRHGGLLRVLLDKAPPVPFITPDSLGAEEAGKRWESIVLTPEEDLVVEAMRTLEPSIERIAFTGPGPDRTRTSRGRFMVKCSGWPQPVPIGSMGDGMWRIILLAIAGVSARDATMLVDEIDTGLHYTVMSDMWKMVRAAAKRFNVQVFATTHSYDCVHSLASICRKDVDSGGDVSIQRLKIDREQAVAFSEREIALAAERQVEIR